jgi:hypothetical protein
MAAAVLRPDTGGDEMRSEADQLGYPLDSPRYLQRDGPVYRIRHPRVQVAGYERRPLDAHQVHGLQAGFPDLLPQFPGPVAKGG